jgi:hypothetical protein
MNKYKDIVVQIIEEANVKVFRLATILSIIGLLSIGCSAGFLEVGTLRTLGVCFGMFFFISPFTLRFFIDKHKIIGAIKFTEVQIITKLIGGEQIIHNLEKINKIRFTILEYEGESKIQDAFQKSTMMKIRTGTENKLFLNINNTDHHYQIYLRSKLQKIKVLYFLNSIEKQIKNIKT